MKWGGRIRGKSRWEDGIHSGVKKGGRIRGSSRWSGKVQVDRKGEGEHGVVCREDGVTGRPEKGREDMG